jgi:hypothetical protein
MGVREDILFRRFLISNTVFSEPYADAEALWEEQWRRRDRFDSMKGPFWSNYFCGKDSRCECRPPDAASLESDAIFFFRNGAGRVLAIHVEFKKTGEGFEPGQPEGYQLRASCFARTWKNRSGLNEHHDWMGVLVCGMDGLGDPKARLFQRVILHDQMRGILQRYPA